MPRFLKLPNRLSGTALFVSIPQFCELRFARRHTGRSGAGVLHARHGSPMATVHQSTRRIQDWTYVNSTRLRISFCISGTTPRGCAVIFPNRDDLHAHVLCGRERRTSAGVEIYRSTYFRLFGISPWDTLSNGRSGKRPLV